MYVCALELLTAGDIVDTGIHEDRVGKSQINAKLCIFSSPFRHAIHKRRVDWNRLSLRRAVVQFVLVRVRNKPSREREPVMKNNWNRDQSIIQYRISTCFFLSSVSLNSHFGGKRVIHKFRSHYYITRL